MRLVLFLLIFPIATLAQSYSVHFSPKGGCQQSVIDEIGKAHSQILVQAYSFTSAPIVAALIEAKHKGIDVKILLDKSQRKGNGSKLHDVEAAGIPVKIDNKPAIAHNKVMVIDSSTTITGSFNFTAGAEERNAENLLVIHDKPLSMQYLANWYKRESLSQAP